MPEIYYVDNYLTSWQKQTKIDGYELPRLQYLLILVFNYNC